jgi:chitinase
MDAGCEFSSGAKGGECTGTKGVLSASEINKIIKNGGKMKLDEEAAVQIVTWDSNQWVSWDDAKTLKMKLDYANENCLGGYVSREILSSENPMLTYDTEPWSGRLILMMVR